MNKIRILSMLMLALVIVAAISVDAQTPLPNTAQSLPVTTATPPPTAPLPALPEVLKDPKLIGLIFAKLAEETARADAEASAKNDQIALVQEWKGISGKERTRADDLEKANADRREEAAQLRASVGFLRESVADYKTQREEDKRTIEHLRSAQKWYAIGGATAGIAGGIVACKAFKP